MFNWKIIGIFHSIILDKNATLNIVYHAIIFIYSYFIIKFVLLMIHIISKHHGHRIWVPQSVISIC